MACSTRFALVCLSSMLLTSACDDGSAEMATTDGSESGDETDGGETDGGSNGELPFDDCPEGYMPVQTEGDCHADAHCFEWGGAWCTGRCPEGSDLWIDIDAVCMPATCAEHEIYRPAGEDCAEGPGIECGPGGWGGHAAWSCERCEFGWYPEPGAFTEDAIACFEGCAEGYELIVTDDECLADAGCYPLPTRDGLDNGWCTGGCPEGQELAMPDDGLPQCVPASSIHDDCVELIWSCPSDDLVCVPAHNECVSCAGLDEDPNAAGGHCCEGLVQDADRTRCIEAPTTDSCIPDGGICGHSGVTIQCCEGTVCSAQTDLCEPA